MPSRPNALPVVARALLVDAVRTRVTPCAVAEVGRGETAIWREVVGRLTYEDSAPAATRRTIFDLASLTKAIATTTLAMRLVDRDRLDLDSRLQQLVPGWRGDDRASATVGDLLEHAAGLPAVLPLYEDHAGRAEYEQAICQEPLAYRPRTRSVYSDLGFMLLGFILADVGGAPLRAQFDGLAASLELASEDEVLRFGPVGSLDAEAGDRGRVAPTQVDSWRGRLLRGEVDDRNGAALDGAAGHTGLFGTVAAVGAFAREMLRNCHAPAPQGRIARASTLARFLERSRVPGSSRAMGWDTMLPSSSCGSRMSPGAFGHTGFTGTSLWIDPASDVYVVLLTNRVHPTAGSGEPIRALRRAFHDAVLEGLGV